MLTVILWIKTLMTKRHKDRIELTIFQIGHMLNPLLLMLSLTSITVLHFFAPSL